MMGVAEPRPVTLKRPCTGSRTSSVVMSSCKSCVQGTSRRSETTARGAEVRNQEARSVVLTGNIACKTAASEMPTVAPSVPSSGVREPQT